MPKHVGNLVGIERHDSEALPYMLNEQHGLFAVDPVLAGHTGQGGVNFNEAVRSAPGLVLAVFGKQVEACRVVDMVAKEDREMREQQEDDDD